MSQTELQKRAKVFQTKISKAERGLITLNQQEQKRIEKVLGCPIDWHRSCKDG
jgi:ribosome-binding protein aMBF1 (putative translation factor)